MNKFSTPLHITGDAVFLMAIADELVKLGYYKHGRFNHSKGDALVTDFGGYEGALGFSRIADDRTIVEVSQTDLILALAAMREGAELHVGEMVVRTKDNHLGMNVGDMATIILVKNTGSIRLKEYVRNDGGHSPENLRKATVEEITNYFKQKTNAVKETKKIVGWALKNKEMEKAASMICGGLSSRREHGIMMSDDSQDASKLREAGVLELWFEPVYVQEPFKAGDSVYIINNDYAVQNYDVLHKVKKIATIDYYPGNGKTFEVKFTDGTHGYASSRTADHYFRLATKEEIEANETWKIGTHKVERVGDDIKVGCQVFTKNQLETLLDLFNRNITVTLKFQDIDITAGMIRRALKLLN